MSIGRAYSFCLFGECGNEPQKEEKVLSNMELFNLLARNIWSSAISGIKLIILKHTIETVTVILVIAIVMMIFKYVIKGRHSLFGRNSQENSANAKSTTSVHTEQSPNQSTKNPITATTNLSVFNTMQYSDGTKLAYDSRDSNIQLLNYMGKPPKYFENMDIVSWLTVMEIFLESQERKHWAKITVTCLDSKCLKRIRDLEKYTKTNDTDYEMLKEELLRLFSKIKVKPNKLNIQSLTTRRQLKHETAEDYGNDLINIAKQLFPNTDKKDLDVIMKDSFAEGLYNVRVKEQVKNKILKTLHSKHSEKITIDDLIVYAKCKEESNMDSTNEVSCKTSSSSDYYSAVSSSHSENEQCYKPKENYFSTQAILNYQYPPLNQMEVKQFNDRNKQMNNYNCERNYGSNQTTQHYGRYNQEDRYRKNSYNENSQTEEQFR